MWTVRRWVGSALACASLIAWSGCGESKPSAEASQAGAGKVTGTVKVHGLPMSGGKITFAPANSQRKEAKATTTEVRADGTFEVTTVTGPNTVTISGPAVKKEPALGGASKTVDVKSGENQVEVSFPD
jgi:hypothetical protein